MPLFHLLYLFKQTQDEHQNKEEEKKEKKGQNKKKRKMGLLGSEHLENIVEAIKDKVKKVKKMKKRKKKTCYAKMDKSSSVKVEIRSRKAQKLIQKTLMAADHPGKAPIS